MPSWSAWMIARTKLESSGVPVRSESFLRASWRASPILISLERERELVRERAGHVLGQLRDRAVEAEPGLDADRHQVERVGQLGADPVLARACLAGDDEVGCDEAETAQCDREEEHAPGTGECAAEDRPEEDPADRERRLEGEERRRRDRASEPGCEQSRADTVDRGLGMELQRPPGQPVACRRQHPLLERKLAAAEDAADLP